MALLSLWTAFTIRQEDPKKSDAVPVSNLSHKKTTFFEPLLAVAQLLWDEYFAVPIVLWAKFSIFF